MLWLWIVTMCMVIGLSITVARQRRVLTRLQMLRRQDQRGHEDRVQEYARQCALLGNDLRSKTVQLELAEKNVRKLIMLEQQLEWLYHDIFRSGKYRGKVDTVKALLAHLELCQAYSVTPEEILLELRRMMQEITDADDVEALLNSLPPRISGSTPTSPL